MTNRDLLKDIRKENKSINRNVRRLINIVLLGVLGKAALEAEEEDDETSKLLSKIGILLVAFNEILLFVSGIIDHKRSMVEDRLDEM